jgi:nucleotide-binding universal stress UspA family protein
MRIVIGVDGSAESAVACELVADRSWPAGTEARLVAVVEAGVFGRDRAVGDAGRRSDLSVELDQLAEPIRRRGIPCELLIETGRPAERLLAHAADWWADLIVVGNRGLGAAASAIFGSVSAHLVDHAPCPVLVVRSPRITRMLLATDGSRSCLDVPRILARWRPAFHGVEVEVVSIATGAGQGADGPVADLPDAGIAEHRRIAEQVADEMSDLGWMAAAVTRAGHPGSEIVHAAEGYGADLVVTGSRCLGTLARVVSGSVAHQVLLGTHASVLVVRGKVPARQAERQAAIPAVI